ncbi:MAG TPA: FAD-dependent oxidoreductase [Anaerolineaceae bacterium]|nr:FAD-dependent oxidoreductase [Anaerolineaceae bacterium]
MEKQDRYLVAVVGAGPAGLFAAKELAGQGVEVILLNRDIKPGGLAEYGIYPEKLKMKEGLRAQFRQILSLPNVHYYGNIVVGKDGDLSLDDLWELGCQAILVTAGAQGTKWLGLPGEDLVGVYHAKDIVYHYNLLPPYSQKPYRIGRRVAVVGVGNVMMDIARYLITEKHVDEVMAIARRGPAEVKFDKKEVETIGANIDLAAYDAEVNRVADIMRAVGQDPDAVQASLHAIASNAQPTGSTTRMTLNFLQSPTRIIGNDGGGMVGLEVEDNTLQLVNGDTKARSLGTRRIVDVDTVIFAIGDRVDDRLGLPVKGSEFVKNPNPSHPVDEQSYEVFDPETNQPIQGIFVAGWSRQASTGLVGVARRDGTNGARAMLQYLAAKTPVKVFSLEKIDEKIRLSGKRVVSNTDLCKLETMEREEAGRRGLMCFKYASDDEMLAAMGLQ